MGAAVSIGPLEFKAYDQHSPEYTGNRKPDQLQRHRCHDRIEDAVRAMSGGWDQYPGNVSEAWRTLFACITSPEGFEPTTPYVVLTPEDKAWMDQAARQQQQEQQWQEQQQQQNSSSSRGSSSSSSSSLKGLG